MIPEFVESFEIGKESLRAVFAAGHPGSYKAIVTELVKILRRGCANSRPDHERVHEINDGDYQGTLVYVIAAERYHPSEYWYVKIDYGSCSVCDALESIRGCSGDKPTEEQIRDYMTLALHIVQGIKKMGAEAA